MGRTSGDDTDIGTHAEGVHLAIRAQKKPSNIGILDHAGPTLGGGQLVVGHLAEVLSQYYNVEVINGGSTYTLRDFTVAFGLDLSKVRERRIPELKGSFGIDGVSSLFRQDKQNTHTLTQPYDLFIYSGLGTPPPCFAKRGLVYCHFPFESSPLNWLTENVAGARRNRFARLVKAGAYRLIWRKRMQGYQRILANSQFTARWIDRRWGKSAEVLYPPVDIEVPVVEKRNIIVSIGRFVGRGRSKNQLEQVDAFREFVSKIREDWILRMIGSCGESSIDQAYLEIVRKAACGLPVEFLLNVDREVVIQSLAEAKLFWHTTGLSSDETLQPGLAEHFGIATVEAMRARCVPVVIASGGQREIIVNGISGFLTKDIDELARKSIAVTGDDKLLSLMGDHAKQRSMAFNRDVFEQRITTVVAECLNQ